MVTDSHVMTWTQSDSVPTLILICLCISYKRTLLITTTGFAAVPAVAEHSVVTLW